MLPVLFEIGGVPVTSFGVFMALSFLVGGWVGTREMRRRGGDPEVIWDLMLYAAVGGIIGAKLYYLILHWPDTVADPGRAILSRAGLVWYGGFFAAWLLVWWRVRRLGLSLRWIGDVLTPTMALGYAIGRMGCFLVGDDYGRPTDVPWAIAFPQGAPPSTAANLREQFGVSIPASIPGDAVLAVHPTQLYEVALTLVIFAIVWRLRTRIATPGVLFGIYLALAGVQRFIVEIYRAKDDRFFGVLSVAQLLSLALVVGGAVAAWRFARRGGGTQVAPPAAVEP